MSSQSTARPSSTASPGRMLANPILDRCWDNGKTVAGAFKADDLGAIACAVSPDPRRLADRAFEQLTQNAHGQYDSNPCADAGPGPGRPGASQAPCRCHRRCHRPAVFRRNPWVKATSQAIRAHGHLHNIHYAILSGSSPPSDSWGANSIVDGVTHALTPDRCMTDFTT